MRMEERNLEEEQIDLTCEADGACGFITLNRPKALNALTDDMRQTLAGALPNWEADPMIYGTISQSSSGRAFCAGGDVRELLSLAQQDVAAARASLRFEYTMNWQIETFTKPHVALIDGMVFGSGVGISSYTTHQVAGPGYAFAMPECAIGLFPDVGGMSLLANLPHRIGLYLALTGARVGPDDALALGLVTHRLTSGEFDDVRAGMREADPIDPILDDRSASGGETPIMDYREEIEAVFSKGSVPEILEELGGASSEWAIGALEALSTQCPLSQAITWRHYHQSRGMDLRDVLIADYRIASRMVTEPDLAEGIRAMLIDKDKAPKWRHSAVSEISESDLDRYFEPAEDGDLDLSERSHEPRV